MVAFMVFISCKKKEFQVAEEGAKVEFTDSVKGRLNELVNQDGGSLFARVWNRASINNMLNNIGGAKGMFTVFRPTDEALTKAGWTASKIDQSSPAVLLELLKLHIVIGKVPPSVLTLKHSSLVLESLYQMACCLYTRNKLPYYFSLGMGIQQNSLIINGTNRGELQFLSATNGGIYNINQLIQPSATTAWEMLKEDPQFSLYTALLEKTDSIYLTIFEQANGYKPNEGHLLAQAYNRISYMRYHMGAWRDNAGDIFVDDLNTFFIPTNQAFQAAGFSTIDDLMQFNKKRGYPVADWQEPVEGYAGFYRVKGEFATDSLLDYHHNWGMRYADQRYARAGTRILIFTNDFGNNALSSLPVASYSKNEGTGGLLTRTESIYLISPFNFNNNTVYAKDTAVATKVIRPNLYSLNGVVHGVDRLLVPKNFSIH
jgi:Secreted and surface protein containing fasciclin-like repeats